MAKDVGMAIRKSIVVLFLVAFLGFHPYVVLNFLNIFRCFFVTYNIVIIGTGKVHIPNMVIL